MKFKYDVIKEDIVKHGYTENNLVAIGRTQSTAAMFGGMIGALIDNELSERYVITLLSNKICIIPFKNSDIAYSEAYGYLKENIKSAKFGKFTSMLKLVLNNGTKKSYAVMKGGKDVIEMLNLLGFSQDKKEKKGNKQ